MEDHLRELRDPFASLPAAEGIARDAARALLPGECAEEIACHVLELLRADGRHLELHPSR